MKKWRWLARMKALFVPKRTQNQDTLLDIDADDYYQIF